MFFIYLFILLIGLQESCVWAMGKNNHKPPPTKTDNPYGRVEQTIKFFPTHHPPTVNVQDIANSEAQNDQFCAMPSPDNKSSEENGYEPLNEDLNEASGQLSAQADEPPPNSQGYHRTPAPPLVYPNGQSGEDNPPPYDPNIQGFHEPPPYDSEGRTTFLNQQFAQVAPTPDTQTNPISPAYPPIVNVLPTPEQNTNQSSTIKIDIPKDMIWASVSLMLAYGLYKFAMYVYKQGKLELQSIQQTQAKPDSSIATKDQMLAWASDHPKTMLLVEQEDV